MLTELRTNVDERWVEGKLNSLTLSTELRKLGLVLMFAPSSNGNQNVKGQNPQASVSLAWSRLAAGSSI